MDGLIVLNVARDKILLRCLMLLARVMLSFGCGTDALDILQLILRNTWLYLLKSKHEVATAFEMFAAMVQTQFASSIFSVQTEIGGEFQVLDNVIAKLGVKLRKSCPYTSQQNDMVERKHRHIVETTLTLLAQASLLLKYWSYADPKHSNLFYQGTATDAELVTTVLIEEYKGGLEGLNSLVDIGGGIGALGKAIAKAFPYLDCTVFDLPHVVAGLQDSGNLTYVGGNMFDEVSAADVVLLKVLTNLFP
ncbi:hypothetical protein GQ457_09G028070 [Hibiscus cannabinus]